MLSKAIALAATKFEGVYDKGGRPYILHCLWVMDRIRHLGDNYMIAAVLHDIVEDTDVSYDDLYAMGFNAEVLLAVKLLTHDNRLIPYQQYIERLSTNIIARAVKMRDLEHNSKITRLKDVRQKDLDRAVKYNIAYHFLKNCKNENNTN